MQAEGLRNWGIAVGAGALAVALSIANMTGNPEPPAPLIGAPEKAQPLPPPAAAPADPTAMAPPAEAPPVFETAGAETPPPPAATQDISFIVRFRGAGPLGRAQALAGEGRDADAQRAARSALANQRSLRGLCLDRFTLGGAEMVLRPCTALPAGEQAAFRDRWLPRLRAMPAIAYAEVNATATPGQRP